jgi:leader peptidase (prepilin peptidase) / N-methyltransferase
MVDVLHILIILGWFLVALFGACLGSFAAVVIFRLQDGVSIVTPRSYCAHCQRQLKVWHNIPIFSWLILRGKCFFCHKPIGLRPLIIELIFSLAMVGLYAKYGFSLALTERVAFFFILVCLSYIDLDSFSLPLGLLWALLLVGLLSTAVYTLYPSAYVAISKPASLLEIMVFKHHSGFSLSDRLWGAVCGFSLLALINVAATLVFRKTKRLTDTQWAMGWGDPLLVFGIGLYIGFSYLVVLLFLASVSGSVVGILLRFCQKAPVNAEDIAQDAIPYGPFLAMAAIYIYVT